MLQARFKALCAAVGTIFVLFSLVYMVALAGFPTFIVNIDSLTCESVTFTITPSYSSGGTASVIVTVDGTPVYTSGASAAESVTITAPLNLPARALSYTVVAIVENEYTDTQSITCSEDEPPVVTPVAPPVDYVCFGPGSVAARGYFDGSRIEIYAISPEDEGQLVMSFSEDYLSTLPEPDGEARLLGDSDLFIPLEFWRNANGLYRLQAGPDGEGKTFECTFGSSCVFEQSWIDAADRIAGEIVPVCAEAVIATPAPTETPPMPTPVATSEVTS